MLNQSLYYTIQYLEPNSKSKRGDKHPGRRRRLAQYIGGARSGQSAMTDDIIGVSGAT